MSFIKSVCLFVVFSLVYVNALGVNVNDVSHGGSDGTAAVKPDNGEERFIDLDGIFSDITKGIDFKVSQSHSQGSSYVKQVTQSHHTVNGQTVTNTEINEFTGNTAVGPGLRFKRDLFEDMIENVGEKAKVVTGAVVDGINIAHNGMYNIKKAIHQRIRE